MCTIKRKTRIQTSCPRLEIVQPLRKPLPLNFNNSLLKWLGPTP